MDYEVDQLEQEREQGNVAKNMTSFEFKADKVETHRTPMDQTITGMPLDPNPTHRLGGNLEISGRMQEKTSRDPDLEIVAHESRRVDGNQRNTICASTN